MDLIYVTINYRSMCHYGGWTYCLFCDKLQYKKRKRKKERKQNKVYDYEI